MKTLFLDTHQISKYWSLKPIKFVAKYLVSNVDKHSIDSEKQVRLCNYTDVYKNEKLTLDFDLMKATATTEQISKFNLQIGDVVITKDSESWNDIAIPCYIEETADDLVCGYHLAIIRANNTKLNGRFLFRCLQSHPVAVQFGLASTGVTRFGLPKRNIGSVLIPLPSLKEQKHIADYLDRQTNYIDELITEKERILVLLDQKQEALINHTVIQGVDRNVELKPSGLKWLDNIPDHWQKVRLKFLITSLEQGSSPITNNVPARGEEFGLLKLSAISKGKFIREENKALAKNDDYFENNSLKKDDILITRGNTPKLVADVCVIPEDEPNLLISDLIYRIRVDKSKILPHFLNLFLLTAQARRQIEADARGSSNSMVKVSQINIKNWSIFLPPLSEQQEIIDHIQKSSQKIDNFQKSLLESIELLKERRSALITSAVTGKIDLEEMKL